MTLTLLFDLDDTLLDSNIESLIPVYFQKFAAHFANIAPPETIMLELMKGTRDMYTSTRFDRTLEQVFSDNFYPALGISQDELAPQLDHFYADVFPTLQSLTKPRPEAVGFVQWAFSQGWTVSIATDPLFPRSAILQRLRWAGLAPEEYPFHLIADFQTFHAPKVSVFYFPEFLARSQWLDGPVLMVGDSVERDILPAQKAGIPVFWLKTPDQSDPAVADVPQGSFADLRNWLETIDISTLKINTHLSSALIASLEGGAAAIHHLSQQLPVSAWAERPSDGEWAFVEILCHLRDVDAEVNLPRFEKVLREQNSFIAGLETDIWAEERGYISQDGNLALQKFFAVRKQMADLLRGLSDADWERRFRHTIFGPTTLRELVGFTVEHDRLHVQQAMRLLQAQISA